MIKKTVSTGILPLSTPLPVRLSEWAEKNFVVVKGPKKEGQWRNLPYQIAILNWLGNDDIEVVTIKKSARTGATKMICVDWAYKTEHLRRDTLIYQPTVEDGKKFKADEIDGLLVHMDSLRDHCRSDPDKRSSNNTVDRINFIGATTDILGGKTPRNFRRMTKDSVYYDELAAFDADIGGEGSATTLGDTRFETSSFPKSVRVSTPKVKGSCQISESLASADVIMYRWVPCPDCNGYQVLRWRDGEKEYRFDFNTSKYICEHCGSLIGYERYADMDKAGQWRSKDGSVIYDESLDMFFENGEPIQPPRHVGVDRLWSAYSYFLGWEKLINIFREATDEMKRTGDFTKLKSFVNTKLGEEWEDRGERVEREIFQQDRLDAPKSEGIDNGVLFITLWADVQGGKSARIEYEVCGWGVDEESWSIEYGTINGEPNDRHVWDHFDAVLKKTYKRQDGVEIGISRAGVDAGYMSDEVYNYTRPRWPRVIATMGHSTSRKPIISGFTYPKKDKKTRLYMIGTDTAKTVIFNRLNKVIEPGPQYLHFPGHYPESYFDQLTKSEEKIATKDKKTGLTYYEFRKISGRRNEALDCKVGNLAVLRTVSPNFQALAARYRENTERARHNLPPSPRPQRRVRSKGVA